MFGVRDVETTAEVPDGRKRTSVEVIESRRVVRIGRRERLEPDGLEDCEVVDYFVVRALGVGERADDTGHGCPRV